MEAVKNRMIELQIDYMQFSFNAMVIGALESFKDFHGKSNMKFYKTMTRYQNGVVVYDGNPNTDRRLAVLSGKVCKILNVGRDFIRESRAWGAKYSRLDLAMTTDVPILEKIQDDHESVISEKFSDGKMIADFEGKPQTLIFGDMKDRSKKGMVRCYDKALELGLDDIILHRIEVENRRNDAEIASKRVENGATIQSVMNSRWRIDKTWYTDMMSDTIATQRFSPDEKPDIPEIEKKMAWIHKQVIPSLKYVIEYDQANGTNNFEGIIRRLGLKLG